MYKVNGAGQTVERRKGKDVAFWLVAKVGIKNLSGVTVTDRQVWNRTEGAADVEETTEPAAEWLEGWADCHRHEYAEMMEYVKRNKLG